MFLHILCSRLSHTCHSSYRFHKWQLLGIIIDISIRAYFIYFPKKLSDKARGRVWNFLHQVLLTDLLHLPRDPEIYFLLIQVKRRHGVAITSVTDASKIGSPKGDSVTSTKVQEFHTVHTSNVALIGNGSPPCVLFSSANSAGVTSPGPSKGDSKFKKWPASINQI